MQTAQHFTAAVAETLGALLDRAKAAPALAEGRVFVNGRRAAVGDAESELSPGARVEVYPPRPRAAVPRILLEKGGLVVADKPAGMATEPERRGSTFVLTTEVARILGLPASEVHAASRLDLGVSGAVLLGLTPEARQRVARLRSEGRLHRRYVALSAATPTPQSGSWSSRIGRGPGGRRRQVSDDGKPSLTLFGVAGTAAAACVLALEPRTGRTHQLRVQAAEHGAPLFGDPTYGGPRQLVLSNGAVHALPRVFLHAAWVEIEPGNRVHAPFPDDFTELWRALTGEPAALERARAIELEGPVPPPGRA